MRYLFAQIEAMKKNPVLRVVGMMLMIIQLVMTETIYQPTRDEL